MTYINYPLVGDPVYAGRPRPPRKADEALLTVLRGFKRQALHAAMLRLAHPITSEIMEWHAPIPDDMVQADAGAYVKTLKSTVWILPDVQSRLACAIECQNSNQYS